MDERLVGVAFLDVGLYVTSLKTLKNLLLIGDAVKSVWFVCFQVSIHCQQRPRFRYGDTGNVIGRSIQTSRTRKGSAIALSL